MLMFHLRRGAAVLALSAACLSGCETLPKTTSPTRPLPAPAPAEPSAKVGPHEAADVKAEYAHMLEKHGDSAAAMNAYREANKQDPSNLDALLGIARLFDADGRFDESMQYYRKAEKAVPKNTKVACNYGFSLYLQDRYQEAESALRQALAREPNNATAHTNLGLVLARTGRSAEAVTEFHRAGCNDADVHANLAFGLMLQKSWKEARAEYQTALRIDPACAAAKKGLQDLENVLSKAVAATE